MLRTLIVLPLMLHDSIDLLCTCALLVKLVTKPLLGQPPCNLDTDYSLAHTQNLSIVAQYRSLDREAVMGGDGTNARDFVRRNSDTETSSADQECAVGFAFCYELCGIDSRVWVGGLVVTAVDTNIDDLLDARVFLEVFLDLVLVAAASVVAANGDGEGFVGHCLFFYRSEGAKDHSWLVS